MVGKPLLARAQAEARSKWLLLTNNFTVFTAIASANVMAFQATALSHRRIWPHFARVFAACARTKGRPDFVASHRQAALYAAARFKPVSFTLDEIKRNLEKTSP